LPHPDDLAARLRAGAPRLAELLVDDALATPLATLVGPGLALAEAAAGALGDDAERVLAERVAAALARLPKARLGTRLPRAVVDWARRVAELDWPLPEALTRRVLGRGPVRRLLREQVLRTLVDFGKRATLGLTENVVARNLTKIAFGTKHRPTPLGSLAEGFADTAVDGVIAGIAAELADPARAREQAAIRVAVLDALLEETGAALAALASPQVGPLLAASRRALTEWLPSLAADLRAGLELALAAELARPAGDLLADLGLAGVVREHATRLLAERLAAFLEKDAFARWLDETLR
jgi:hypothetical protein